MAQSDGEYLGQTTDGTDMYRGRLLYVRPTKKHPRPLEKRATVGRAGDTTRCDACESRIYDFEPVAFGGTTPDGNDYIFCADCLSAHPYRLLSDGRWLAQRIKDRTYHQPLR